MCPQAFEFSREAFLLSTNKDTCFVSFQVLIPFSFLLLVLLHHKGHLVQRSTDVVKSLHLFSEIDLLTFHF